MAKKSTSSDLHFNETDINRLIQELEMQNQELRHAKEDALVAAHKYTQLYDFAPVGYFTLSQSGFITELNFKAAEFIDKPRQHLKNRQFSVFVTDETRATFTHFMERVFASCHQETCEISFLSKDNQLLNIQLIGIEEEQTNNCLITAIDITELTNTLQLLKKNEDKFRSIFVNIQDVYFQTNLVGVVLEVSPSIETYSGYSAEEVIGQSVEQFFDNSNHSVSKELLFNTLKHDGELRDCELSLMSKSGENKQVSINAHIIYSENGEPNHIDGSIRDISERKIAEESLIKSEEKYRYMFANNPQPMWIIDWETLEFLEVNQAAIDHLGYSRDEFLAMTGKDIRPVEDIPLFLEYIKADSPLTSKIEARYKKKNGEIIFVEIIAHPIDFDGRKARHILINDITEKKRAIEELEESKNKITTILNAIPDLIFIQNNAGDYIDCHVAQADDLHTTPDQFMGKNMSEVLPEEIYQSVRATFNKAIETKQVQSLEYSIPTPIGEQFFDMKVIAYDEDRLLSICRNITEGHQAVSALKESEEQLKEIFDNSADNIFVIDVIGSHTFILRRANKSMVNVLNKSNEEIENQLVETVFQNHKETMYESHYQQCIDKRAVHRYEEIAEIGDRLINYSTVLVPLFDASGKVFRLIGISRDSTEHKQREASMIHADRMTSLGEMASGMAHEINQPMNNISMVMENMLIALNRDVHIPEDYMRNKLSRVFENIERIRKIIDHVRVFSRKNIESEQIYFDVNESIAKSISMVNQQFYDNRIKLNYNLQDGLPEIDGNLYKFEQVILNLLSNGRDSLLEKRANAKILNFNIDDQFINIKSYLEGNQIKITVSDNGMGIDQSIINHIMLPFYTTKEVGKGTGLGLSISHQIINEMNGNIEITSELGISTTFTIILNIEKRD